MERRSNYAAVKDVQIKLTKEECVLGMVQRSKDAAAKDALIMLKKEEFVSGTGPIACEILSHLKFPQRSCVNTQSTLQLTTN